MEQTAQTAGNSIKLETVDIPVKYAFKTNKETGVKRETVISTIPVPTLESIFGIPDLPKEDIFETQKDTEGKDVQVKTGWKYSAPEHQAIFELITDELSGVGKAIVDETESNEQIQFPQGTFDFSTLVRKPKYARKEGSVPKETLEELCESYSKAMKAAGKVEKGIKIATHFFMRRAKGLDSVRPELVSAMRANLGAWFAGMTEDEQSKFAQAYQLLDGRIGDALAEDVASVM